MKVKCVSCSHEWEDEPIDGLVVCPECDTFQSVPEESDNGPA